MSFGAWLLKCSEIGEERLLLLVRVEVTLKKEGHRENPHLGNEPDSTECSDGGYSYSF